LKDLGRGKQKKRFDKKKKSLSSTAGTHKEVGLGFRVH
jgi:hypothetical protein